MKLFTGTVINNDVFTATANIHNESAGVTIDDAIGPGGWGDADIGAYIELNIDMGSELALDGVKIYTDDANSLVPEFFYSTNGTDYVSHGSNRHDVGNIYDEVVFSPQVTARYLRISKTLGSIASLMNIIEVVPYRNNNTAIQTTGATQIDGGTNFWQWETFTDTKTVPANTSIIYRYRTSPDSTTWTAWVGSIGAVTSRTGDDSNNPIKYRYLQIEATLSNTNGVSTPTIDQYDIGYHTNQPPNKPTALTAVVN